MARSCSIVKSATRPVWSVESSTVASWITARSPSAVSCTSSSSMSAPSSSARSKAYIVFIGASSSPPEWAMFITR